MVAFTVPAGDWWGVIRGGGYIMFARNSLLSAGSAVRGKSANVSDASSYLWLRRNEGIEKNQEVSVDRHHYQDPFLCSLLAKGTCCPI